MIKVFLLTLVAALQAATAVAATATESQKAIQDLCQNTNNQQICVDSLTKATDATDPKTLIQISFQLIINEVRNVIQQLDDIRKSSNDPAISDPRASYGTCQLWLGRSIEDLQRAVDEVGSFDPAGDLTMLTGDIQTYISGASTYHTSCMDCFEEDPAGAARVGELMKGARELTVNGLALANGIPKLLKQT